MGELLAAIVWVIGAYGFGRWDGKRRAEKAFLSPAKGTKAGKCAFCGVPIEGTGLDMEAHVRFYCPPPNHPAA